MATGEPRTPAVQPGMEALMHTLTQQLQEAARQAAEEPTCVRNPNVTSEDYALGALKGLKLEVEGELEALLDTPLVHLPHDPALLVGVAKEEVQRTAHWNARTLEFYKKKLEEVKDRHKKYETMVRRATLVNQALDKLQVQHSTEEDKRIALQRRHNKTAVVFRFLRSELQFILKSLYPENISTPESVNSMEDILDSLVSKMMKEPSDPYVEIDNTMEEGHLMLLLSANLIARHPTDTSRIKFIDPRAA